MGGTSASSMLVTYATAYGTLPEPTPSYSGHTFVGWYTEKTGGRLVESTPIYLEKGNSTIYAHWE